MTSVTGRIRGPFVAWPGRIETPGLVKRRLLLVASIAAITVSGVYTIDSLDRTSPWTSQEQRDMAGLPDPPAQYAPIENGQLRQLSPEEYAQLQEIRALVERFPVPDEFAKVGKPGRGGRKGGP
jgi:hypothetical protein